MIDALSRMGDEELWRTIRTIAGKYNVRLKEEVPPAEELNKLRALLKSSDKLSPTDALRIIASYKKRR